jgi:glycosyltransferase involved in cell wall biosynthesis
MRLSIITINYNNADGLRKTMVSVFAQTYRDFEYIIVDGASTDGSVDVIRELASSNPLTPNPLTLTWSSEPDTGIYNAMNKGIEIASGKRVVDTFNRSKLCGDKNKGNEESYVLMLNSGDYFVDEHVVERVLPELDGTDIIQGNVIVETDEKEKILRGYGKSDLSFIDVMWGFFLHQASFCKIDVFERYGYFDESYRIGGDTVFYAKCLGFGDATFKYIDQNIAYFDDEGVSAASSGKWYEIHKEENLRYEKMFSRRMWRMRTVEENKIRLYDRLHAHWWSWKLTVALSSLVNLIYRNKQ